MSCLAGLAPASDSPLRALDHEQDKPDPESDAPRRTQHRFSASPRARVGPVPAAAREHAGAMSRALRSEEPGAEEPGAFWHVTSRGRVDLYLDDVDRRCWVDLLGDAVTVRWVGPLSCVHQYGHALAGRRACGRASAVAIRGDRRDHGVRPHPRHDARRAEDSRPMASPWTGRPRTGPASTRRSERGTDRGNPRCHEVACVQAGALRRGPLKVERRARRNRICPARAR